MRQLTARVVATMPFNDWTTSAIATGKPIRAGVRRESSLRRRVAARPPPPDLNCGDIPFQDFTVLPPDPHGFDGNNDGVGCQS
jgi:hypothetical protein